MVRTNKKWYLPLVIAGLAVFLAGCASAGAARAETHWGYSGGAGPEFWADLNPEYALARDGKAQSPINIDTASLTAEGAPAKPEFRYTGVLFTLENNGHTVELVPAEPAGVLVLDGADFALRQLHFHAPGEHRIDGLPAVMEVHLVHQDAAAGNGAVAVVGFLIKAGTENETFRETFASLPKAKGGAFRLETPVDLTALFSNGGMFYRYDGSLTTPPCTEGVQWSVANTFVELSREQIAAFTALYPNNSRPVQALNGRKVFISN
jgi:carbonic anhydrase